MIASMILRKTKRKIADRKISSKTAGTELYKIIKSAVIVFSVIILSFLVETFFKIPIKEYLTLLYNMLNKPFIVSGSLSISILTIILLIPIFYFASKFGKFICALVKTSVSKNENFSDARKFRIEKIAQYGASASFIIIGLSIIGINLSSIAVIFGVFGIGIGFGLQNIISNFSAGIIIFFTSPVKEGDRITVGPHEGYITKINTISTIITNLYNETIIVPNSQLISDTIYNHTYSGKNIVIENFIRASYESDIDFVIDLISETVEQNPYILKGEKPDVRISAFEASDILMVVYTTITDIAYKGKAKAWNNLELWHSFCRNGIDIPVNRADIKLTGSSIPEKRENK